MVDFPAQLAWPDFVYDLAELLRARGLPSQLYLVGGAVRDAYLRGAIKDIDIAVAGNAIAIARRVADWLDGDIYIMDRERGVARVFLPQIDNGERICLDFARLRGPTLAADLRDRDFTLNAMAADLLDAPETLIDPLGGAADLRQKVLRRCQPSAIPNDPIRALRAVRLSAQFKLKIEPATTADIRRYASALRQTSNERVRDEFFKLLSLDSAARALRVTEHLGLLPEIVPGNEATPLAFATVERLSALIKAISNRRSDNTAAAFGLGMLVIQFDRYRPQLQAHLNQVYGNGRRHSELLLLAALRHNAGDAAAAAAEMAAALKLTVDERRKLATALQQYRQVVKTRNWSLLEQHRFWHKLGASGIDAILLAVADVLASSGSALRQSDWLEFVEAITLLVDAYFNKFDSIVKPPPLLNGNDIRVLLGIKPGPQVGRSLKRLREAQVVGAVNTAEEARAFILRGQRSKTK